MAQPRRDLFTTEDKRQYPKKLQTHHLSEQIVQAVNNFPVISYSLYIIKWTSEELCRLDSKTRKLLACHGLLHPRADADRLNVPREEGGRGFTEIASLRTATNVGMAKYIKIKHEEKLLGLTYHHEKNMIENILADLPTPKQIENTDENNSDTKRVKQAKKNTKTKLEERRKNNWNEKKMHGQFLKEREKQHIGKELTWKWLKNGDLKGETEELIMSCQDQDRRKLI